MPLIPRLQLAPSEGWTRRDLATFTDFDTVNPYLLTKNQNSIEMSERYLFKHMSSKPIRYQNNRSNEFHTTDQNKTRVFVPGLWPGKGVSNVLRSGSKKWSMFIFG